MDGKCEMNVSVLWNVSFVRGVLFYDGIFACICKIVFIIDFQSVCVLFAFSLLCVYDQDYILEPHRAFVSCSSKSSCLDLSIHTIFNAITS